MEDKEYEYVHDYEWNSEMEEKCKNIISENNELINQKTIGNK